METKSCGVVAVEHKTVFLLGRLLDLEDPLCERQREGLLFLLMLFYRTLLPPPTEFQKVPQISGKQPASVFQSRNLSLDGAQLHIPLGIGSIVVPQNTVWHNHRFTHLFSGYLMRIQFYTHTVNSQQCIVCFLSNKQLYHDLQKQYRNSGIWLGTSYETQGKICLFTQYHSQLVPKNLQYKSFIFLFVD